MERVALEDTPAQRKALFELLVARLLLVATPPSDREVGAWTAQPGDTLSFVTLQTDDGPVWPVFTSEEALLSWRPEGSRFAEIPARALFEMAAANGTARIDINPASGIRGSIVRREIEALARGRLPLGGSSEVITEETKVRIGQAAVPPPDDVVQAVVDALEREPLAASAWLFLMQQGNLPPEHVVGVAFADSVAERDHQGGYGSCWPGVGEALTGHQQLRRFVITPDLRHTLQNGAGRQIFTR